MTLCTQFFRIFATVGLAIGLFFPVSGGTESRLNSGVQVTAQQKLELGRLEERITHLLNWHYRLSEGLSENAIIADERLYERTLFHLDTEVMRLSDLMDHGEQARMDIPTIEHSLDRAERLVSELRRTIRYE